MPIGIEANDNDKHCGHGYMAVLQSYDYNTTIVKLIYNINIDNKCIYAMFEWPIVYPALKESFTVDKTPYSSLI